jgi:Transglycosylase SLT domain
MSLSSPQSVQGRTQVREAIADAAARTGVDFGFLYSQAQIESSLDPDAKAPTSSAAGLFQFTRQTWLSTLKEHGPEHGLAWAADAISRAPDGRYTIADPALRSSVMDLRYDAAASSAMAAEFARDNQSFLQSELGRALEPVDLYLAHFLGPAGAAEFLSAHDADPEGLAASAFPAAASANRSIFYDASGRARSYAEVRTRFADRMAGPDSAPPPMSTASYVKSRAAQAVFGSSRASDAGQAMRSFEAMPGQLSLRFAAAAYRRLEALGPGGRN